MVVDSVKFIGSVFLVWGISAILHTLFFGNGLAPILWFSYIGLIVLAIGCFRRDGDLIASQLCIIFIPYLVWNVDFFSHLFTGESVWGTADYFFKSGPLLGKIITLQHVFNLPLSFYALRRVGLRTTKFWLISVLEITVLFFITRFVTTSAQNVNCVFHNCATFDFGLWYPLQWFLAQGLMIALTSWGLTRVYVKKA
jgi:hypothetical protein